MKDVSAAFETIHETDTPLLEENKPDAPAQQPREEISQEEFSKLSFCKKLGKINR